MKRKRASNRGHVLPILAAAGVGYLIGAWHAAVPRGAERSAPQTVAETIALRFPSALGDEPVVQAASFTPAASAGPANAADNAQLAIFSPQPMIAPTTAALNAASPSTASQNTAAPVTASAAFAQIEPQDAAQAADRPPSNQIADIAPLPSVAALSPAAAAPIAPKPAAVARIRPVVAHHQARRARYFLDDAQIADIKRRLHLTPDQEQMWPAVEAALRSIGTQREREARWHGAAAPIDPNSPQVEDLKSAAIPLLMSFSDEQKDEVRDLARNMGLNQLASEF